MQDYINLINFLKENDEEVKKDLEKLRFWCKWFTLIWWNPVFLSHRILWIWTSEYNPEWKYSNNDTIEIIWNNLDYHHIMMYCNNIEQTTARFDMYWHFINEYGEVEFQLDYTKPFHLQDGQVFKSLVEYFKSINK